MPWSKCKIYYYFFHCFFSFLFLFNPYLISFLLSCLHSPSDLFFALFHFPSHLYYIPTILVFLSHWLFRGRDVLYILFSCFNIILNFLFFFSLLCIWLSPFHISAVWSSSLSQNTCFPPSNYFAPSILWLHVLLFPLNKTCIFFKIVYHSSF